jgi:cell division protein ZapB
MAATLSDQACLLPCDTTNIARMSLQPDTHEPALSRLETRIEELLRTCDRLSDENRSLRQQQASLAQERAQLIEKTEMARSRVESMIARLKAMEHKP